jgi:hypothetical protein
MICAAMMLLLLLFFVAGWLMLRKFVDRFRISDLQRRAVFITGCDSGIQYPSDSIKYF